MPGISWWETAYWSSGTYNPFDYASSADKYRGKLTPYAGLIYNLDAQYSVYASYSTTFQPQALRDISVTLLKPLEGE